MEVSGQLHAPAALPQEKSPYCPLDRRLGGPQSRSGRSGEEKSPQSPPGFEPPNPDRPARSPVAIPTELSRFSRLFYKDTNRLIVQVCVPLKFLSQWIDFHKTWCDHDIIGGQPTFVLFNFLSSITATWWLCEFL
jgi:hypothetical protein